MWTAVCQILQIPYTTNTPNHLYRFLFNRSEQTVRFTLTFSRENFCHFYSGPPVNSGGLLSYFYRNFIARSARKSIRISEAIPP